MAFEVIGQPIARVDGRLKVTGAAQYAADFNRPGQAHGVIVAANVGLGRITTLETASARDMPGVLAVISHLNAPRLAYLPHKGFIDPEGGERLYVFQNNAVRFYGQPIAVVVAETLDQAERAAAALAVTYDADTPLVDLTAPEAEAILPEAANKPGTRIRADTARGDADVALGSADVSLDRHYDIAREHHNPMEPHATLAEWQGDRLTLWSKSQWVTSEQGEIAAIFGIPPGHVQVICPFIGGAFGTSLRSWPHVTIAELAARIVRRPV